MGFGSIMLAPALMAASRFGHDRLPEDFGFVVGLLDMAGKRSSIRSPKTPTIASTEQPICPLLSTWWQWKRTRPSSPTPTDRFFRFP